MDNWLLVAATFLAVGPATAAPGAERERAVESGLDFLVKAQAKDGAWEARPRQKSVGVTSLAVLAFLAAGEVPGKGPRGEAAEKGLRWVLSQQQASGILSADRPLEMYHHGIATLMLASAHGVCDRKRKAEVRKALDRAVAVIVKAQRQGRGPERGGWRYRVEDVNGSDLSVTGWQALALAAARKEGCEVPQGVLDGATDFIRRCQEPRTGGLRYTIRSNPTVTCTATGLLGLCLLVKDGRRAPVAVKAAEYLHQKANRPRWPHHQFFDAAFHATQAVTLFGGAGADEYRKELWETLRAQQKDNGSWTAAAWGPAYGTAMAVLALTAEDRRLPVFKAAGPRP
jgi:hypothetical protein